MFRRAATQLATASVRATGASSSSIVCFSSSSGGGGGGGGACSSSGIGSIARSFASSSAPAASSAALSRRVRPVPTLAWAAATALATTSLLILPSSKDAAKAEEAAAVASTSSTAAPAAASSDLDLYSLPAATGLFSSPSPSASSPSSPHSSPSSFPALPPLTLYQYEVCPFCCKVKAVLDFYKVPYRVVEVSPLTKRQLKWGALRKVPVLALGEVQKGSGGGKEEGGAFAPLPGVEVLADSSLIISRIAVEAQAAGMGPAAAGSGRKRSGSGSGSGKAAEGSSWFRRSSPPSPSSRPIPPPLSKEASWRKWVDGRLVKVITVNIYRTAKESWQTFDYISETGDFGGVLEKSAARVVGAGMMWAIAGRLAKKYGVEGEPRAALEAAGREWTEGALRRGGDDGEGAASSTSSDAALAAPFAGGDSPDLSDLSAFGVWKAVSKTDSFEDAMRGNAELRAWYGRVERAVGASSRVE